MPNNKGEPCCHRCGFAAFALAGMRTECAKRSGCASTFRVALRDHGPGCDNRGFACARVVDPSASLLSPTLRFAKPRPGFDLVGAPNDDGDDSAAAKTALDVSTRYFSKVDVAFADMAPGPEGIRVRRLPIYTLSTGVVMPSIGFVVFENLPYACEEFYVGAILAALYRDFPRAGACDADRARAFCDDPRTSPGALGWDDKGSVLMTAAMMLPTTFPYLYDYGISRDGTKLVSADEFTRTLMLTMSGDCEDDSLFALAFLADVLTASSAPNHAWTSRIVRNAQVVRSQYVATIALKAVTRPAQSSADGGLGSQPTTFAAHACCDAIPIRAFRRMVAASGVRPTDVAAIDAIIVERASVLIPENESLSVVVGEGTGCVASHSRRDQKCASWAKQEARKILSSVANSIRTVSREHLPTSSVFYKHVASALVHDTLLSEAACGRGKWFVPQVVYATRRADSSKLIGTATHEDYYSCRQNVVACPIEPPSADVIATIEHLCKYEHPIPPISNVPATIAAISPERAATFSRVSAAAAETTRRLAKTMSTTNGDATMSSEITVCFPLYELTDSVGDDLVRELSRSDTLAEVLIDARSLAEDVAVVIVHMRFARRSH